MSRLWKQESLFLAETGGQFLKRLYWGVGVLVYLSELGGKESFLCLPLSLLQGSPEVFVWHRDPRSMVKMERNGSGAELEEDGYLLWLELGTNLFCCVLVPLTVMGEKSSLLFSLYRGKLDWRLKNTSPTRGYPPQSLRDL